MEKEKIEELKKDKKNYEEAISKLDQAIELLLDGRPEKTEREDGLFDYHPKFDVIKKVKFQKAQIETRLNKLIKHFEVVI